MAMSQKLQDRLAQYQALQEQFQLVSAQKAQFSRQRDEVETAVGELNGDPKGTFYKSVGGLLVKVKDPAELAKVLSETKETLDIKIRSLERQEGPMREKLTGLQQELSAALKGSGPGAG